MFKMSSESIVNDKNCKEKFLDNLKSQEIRNFNEIQNSPEIKDDASSTISEKLKKEKIGMLVSAISVLFGSCGQIYTKIIQKTFPNDFRTVQFLFLRSFTIFFFAIFHSYIRREKIMHLRDIPEKKWFFMRTNANFFGVACMTCALWYLRATTTIIIQNVHPLFVLIMSYFVLKEKFYLRYLLGILICFFGALIMILNEAKVKVNNMKTFSEAERSIGLFFAFIDLFFISSVKVSNKVMVNKKVPIGTQMFYVSISTMIYSSIYTIFFGGLCFKIGYLLMCLVHGIFFYLGNITQNYALQLCPLSKIILIQYLNVVYIFLLSFIFLGEKIFFSDIMGASFIIGFMLYNSYYPLPVK